MGKISSKFFQHRHDSFELVNPVVHEVQQKLVNEEQFAKSFAQFIKNGYWLNSITQHGPENGNIDHVQRKRYTPKMGDANWIFLDFILPEGSKGITDTFLHESSALKTSILAMKKKGQQKTINNSVSQDFQDAYDYNPDHPPFTLDDMCIILFAILFPLYLSSMEFKHWKEWKMLNSDGTHMDFESYAGLPEVDEECEVEEQMFEFKDITHLKQMLHSTAAFFDESELERRFTQVGVLDTLRTALDRSPFGISICSARAFASYPILYVNKAVLKMTGYRRSEMLGRNFKMLQGEETEPSQLDIMTQALKEQKTIRLAVTNYRKDGSKFLNLMALKPSFDHEGKCKYVIGVYYDISRKEASLAELQRVKDVLTLLPSLLNFPEDLVTKSLNDIAYEHIC